MISSNEYFAYQSWSVVCLENPCHCRATIDLNWGAGGGLNMVVAHPVKMMLFQSAGFVLIIFGQASSLTASSVLVKFIIFHCVNIYFAADSHPLPKFYIPPLLTLEKEKKKKKEKISITQSPKRLIPVI